MKSFGLILILIIFSNLSLRTFADVDSSECEFKIRLPQTINRSQPVLVPVITLDGSRMYFDRREHPDNTGGYKDLDDIWYSERADNDVWSEPKRIPAPVNSDSSDVIFSISPDGFRAFCYGRFSASENSDPGYAILINNNGEWALEQKIFINEYYNRSGLFSANMSFNSKIILLSAIQDEGFGSHDLYVSTYNEQTNKWDKAKNLGETINTLDVESSPFLAYDGLSLYFSSNGRDGIGKQDLYVSRRLDNTWTNWSKPENLGPAINTKEDDKSIYLTALGDTAYVVSWDTTSKRSGIYSVCLPENLRPRPYTIIHGKVYLVNGESKTLVKDKILLKTIDRDGFKYESYTNPETGLYIIIDNRNEEKIELNVAGKKVEIKKSINRKIINSPIWYEHDIYLDDEKPIINNKLLATVYFEYDRYCFDDKEKDIIKRTISSLDTKKLVFELIGHADSSGTEKYNYELSRKRAATVSAYLKKLGIKNRSIKLIAKGELAPSSDNPEKNRRVDIYISNAK